MLLHVNTLNNTRFRSNLYKAHLSSVSITPTVTRVPHCLYRKLDMVFMVVKAPKLPKDN